MGKKQKKTLEDKDIHFCDDFKEKRLKCGKSQQEWADAVGISLGLVKGIEGYSRKCTQETEEKVKNYMAQLNAAPDAPDTRSLEERILSDMFLNHMGRIGKNEAVYYADSCIRPVQKILSYADRFETKNELKLYLQYLAMSFRMLERASLESASAITSGLEVLDIAAKLYSDFEKKLAKNYKTAMEIPSPKDGTNEKQISIFDLDTT